MIADELKPFIKSHIGRNNSNNPPGRYISIPAPSLILKMLNISNTTPSNNITYPIIPSPEKYRGISFD
jgi:hypothetical protein